MVLFENLLYNDRYVVTDFYNFDDNNNDYKLACYYVFFLIQDMLYYT